MHMVHGANCKTAGIASPPPNIAQAMGVHFTERRKIASLHPTPRPFLLKEVTGRRSMRGVVHYGCAVSRCFGFPFMF